MEGQFKKDDLHIPIPVSFQEQWGQAERLILSGLKQGDKKKACADLRFLHKKMIEENRVGGDDTLGNLGSALNVYERQLVKKLGDLNKEKPGLLGRTKLNKEKEEVDKIRSLCHNAALAMNGVAVTPFTTKTPPVLVAVQTPTQGEEFLHSSYLRTLLFPRDSIGTHVSAQAPTDEEIHHYIAERVRGYRNINKEETSASNREDMGSQTLSSAVNDVCTAQKAGSEERSQTGPIEDPYVPFTSPRIYPDLFNPFKQPVPDAPPMSNLQMPLTKGCYGSDQEKASEKGGNFAIMGNVSLTPLRSTSIKRGKSSPTEAELLAIVERQEEREREDRVRFDYDRRQYEKRRKEEERRSEKRNGDEGSGGSQERERGYHHGAE
ncbi:uncharacterized protein LOC117561323 isoform X2 [Gymnodraco acuticeps]|uniref:Uncharacterized protein LOC117561323 isoform X2 n=1 Tax=Gymnodraco acuticeps TaxID=8218 RepID=A0A6P8VU37_GYMAC|nr:uncharacterized protein LOC117561323 isoform X2 [Gymnodraco acuticeps]